tara:strand:+ start:458 stop:2239 length:1782 start_codon:yes stop_codon:yes gene_type:complete
VKYEHKNTSKAKRQLFFQFLDRIYILFNVEKARHCGKFDSHPRTKLWHIYCIKPRYRFDKLDLPMTENLLSAFDKLLKFEGDADSHCRIICENRDEFGNLSQTQESYIHNRICNFLSDDFNITQNLALSVFFLSIYASYLHDEKINPYIYKVFNQFSNFKVKNAFIYNLLVIAFRKNIALDEPLAKIFHSLVLEFKAHYSDLKLEYDTKDKRKTILLTTSQILNENHSPTVRLLELYDVLLELGFDPLVVQIQSYPIDYDLAVIEPSKGNYIDVPEGLRLWEFGKREVPVYNLEANRFNKNSFKDFFEILNKVKPALMLSVGGFNVFQEFLASYIPSLIDTSSTMLVPSPFSSLVSVFKKLSPTQISALESANLDPKKYKKLVNQAVKVEALFGRDLATKSDFGYKTEEILLAIVSNRLDWEIGHDEIMFIKNTLDLDPKIKFLLIGSYRDQLRLQVARECGQRVEFHGPTKEIKPLLNMVDFLINTKRLGGGGAAGTALGHGTLVFSINYGDVASFLPPEYLADDYDQLLQLVEKHLHFDISACQQMAYSIFDQFSSLKDNVQKLLKLVEWKQAKSTINAISQRSPSSLRNC